MKEFWFRLWSVWNTSPATCSLSKTGSSPHRRCVLLSLRKARAHDRGAGRADGGRLPTGSDPRRRARCQAEGGKPDGEHKERNCSCLPSERIMVGLNELKGLFQPKCFYDRGGEADSRCTWVCTCPEHRTPQSLLCWVMAAWEQTACPRAAAGSIAPRGDREGNSGGCSIRRAGTSPFWAWSLQGLHPAAVTTSGTQLGCPSLAAGHKMWYPKGNSFGAGGKLSSWSVPSCPDFYSLIPQPSSLWWSAKSRVHKGWVAWLQVFE